MPPAALLLFLAAAAQGQLQHTRMRTGGSKTFPSNQLNPVLLSFAPASGTGLPSVADLCDTYASELTGNFVCQKGDGTVYSGSRAMTSTGSPVTSSFPVCPNGLDCTAVTSQLYTGASTQKWATASVAQPLGSFSACAVFAGDDPTANSWLFHQDDAVVRGWELQYASSAAPQFLVWKTNAASSTVASVAGSAPMGAWTHVCGTYQYIADGSSVLTLYVNGAVNGTPVTTGVGPTQAGSSIIAAGSGPFTNYKGRLRNSLFTEKVLSPTVIAAMARSVLADVPTGTSNEALTFTRGSVKFCPNSTGEAGSWLPTGRPCIAANGIHIEGARTNLTIRSTAFDNAAWTKTNVTAPTADTQLAPDGTTTAEVLAGTANGGLVESTAAAITGTVGTASVYVRTTAGTQANVTIILRDTTAGADRCTGTTTATTTWARLTCNSASITTTNNHTVRVYPGGTAGTGTVVAWGAQQEAASFASSVIVTAGTSVARSADVASFAKPAALTDTAGCVGATILITAFDAALPNRVLDFDSASNQAPIYISSATTAGSYDGTNFGTGPNLGALANVSTRLATGWAGTTTTLYRASSTTTATYDGSWASAGVVVLGNGNSSSYLFGTLSDIKLGRTTGACQ